MEPRQIEFNDVERVQTGAIQFGSDWPGLFIRGDESLYLMQVIDRLLKKFDIDLIDRAELLVLKDIIEKDVLIQPK